MRTRLFKYLLCISLLLVFLLSIKTGYATFQESLSIDSTITIPKDSWDIYLNNLVPNSENITALNEAALIKNSVSFAVNFINIDDKYQFSFDVVNNGTTDSKLQELIITGFNAEGNPDYDLTIKYSDGDDVKPDDVLPSKTTKTINVLFSVKESAILPSSNFDISIKPLYIPAL